MCWLRTVALVCLLGCLRAGADTVGGWSRVSHRLEGWEVRVDERLLGGEHEELGVRALRFLESKLSDIVAVVPSGPLARLREVVIVMDLECGGLGSMQYHPSAEWLRGNGYAEELARCVHIPIAAQLPTRRNINEQPWVILHELAHAYHDQVLGFDEPRVVEAYEDYKRSGSGEATLLFDGSRVRHYALTDHKEFFAEMSESYFGVDDFFPFNRAELLTAEPGIYGLMREIWEGAVVGDSGVWAGEGVLRVESPVDYQVFQRRDWEEGVVWVRGRVKGEVDGVKIVLDGRHYSLVPAGDGRFELGITVEAGGWYACGVRAERGGRVMGERVVAHVGVGEVFVVAGQSNSANHGEERLRVRTGRVSAFDGEFWRIADDPQPGASGAGGSFLPVFGDLLVEELGVPVGLVSCGIGATSVREWLPRGWIFPNPPTLTGRVRQLESGEWASDGAAFEGLMRRMELLGVFGCRAVLWHQGESDANQADPTRTLAGDLYRRYLGDVITESRRLTGWRVPWFVAQASYHVPGDEGSPDIRAAQAALWRGGVALEGPDTDQLQGAFREAAGEGVHFSGVGQREHGRMWAEKVLGWLERQAH